jgi:hypothetical protein
MKNRLSTTFLATAIILLSLLLGVHLYQVFLKPYLPSSKASYEQSLEIPTDITANDLEQVKKNCPLSSFTERKVNCSGVHKHGGTLYVIVYYDKNNQGADIFVTGGSDKLIGFSEVEMKRHFKRITFSKVAK